MKVQQISIFLENKPGRLSAPAKLLAATGVSIITLSLADTHQFGILRMIVTDQACALEVLRQAGFIVKTNEVVAVAVEDRPGGLAEVLEAMEDSDINVEYMYAFTSKSGDKAILIFRFEQPDAAIALLQQRGINVIGQVELFERASR